MCHKAPKQFANTNFCCSLWKDSSNIFAIKIYFQLCILCGYIENKCLLVLNLGCQVKTLNILLLQLLLRLNELIYCNGTSIKFIYCVCPHNKFEFVGERLKVSTNSHSWWLTWSVFYVKNSQKMRGFFYNIFHNL